MGHIVIDVDEVLANRQRDERVKIDNQSASLIPESQRCQRCEGTGNQMMFMYQQCIACGGDGRSRGNEEAIRAAERSALKGIN